MCKSTHHTDLHFFAHLHDRFGLFGLRFERCHTLALRFHQSAELFALRLERGAHSGQRCALRRPLCGAGSQIGLQHLQRVLQA
jgi:hypothetical protein